MSSFPRGRAPTNGNAGLHSKECSGGKEKGNLRSIVLFEKMIQANKNDRMKAAWQKKDEPFLS